MNYDDFIGAVQNRAHLGERQAAIRATRATLETYGERLTEDQSNKLAAQLPQEIGEYLRHAGGHTERFDSSEFFRRVGSKENEDLPAATHHARVVTEVLQEAVSEGEITKVRNALPEDYQRIFEAGSAGKMPA
jgi:uncharacterized protein (DUF2267 family)